MLIIGTLIAIGLSVIGNIALIVRRKLKSKKYREWLRSITSLSRKYREQVQSVTSLDRGTWSERDLIPQLLNKCGINQRAIYHDLHDLSLNLSLQSLTTLRKHLWINV